MTPAFAKGASLKTLYLIMLQNGQTYFKNLAVFTFSSFMSFIQLLHDQLLATEDESASFTRCSSRRQCNIGQGSPGASKKGCVLDICEEMLLKISFIESFQVSVLFYFNALSYSTDVSIMYLGHQMLVKDSRRKSQKSLTEFLGDTHEGQNIKSTFTN